MKTEPQPQSNYADPLDLRNPLFPRREPPPATDDKPCEHRWRRIIPVAQEQCSKCGQYKFPQCNHKPATDDRVKEQGSQEWTPERLGNETYSTWVVNTGKERIACGNEQNAKSVSDAHNAELAAEREGDYETCAQWEKLYNELSAENVRQSNEILKLATSLLQAQVAIAEVLKSSADHNTLVAAVLKLKTIDLSALDKHDAEVEAKAYALGAQHQHKEDELVRKPLVDALEAIRDNWRYDGSHLASIARDALATIADAEN